MPEQINWSFNVQVVGGPQLGESKPLTVEAYDKIDVTIPGGDDATPGAMTVDVQPGGAGQVRFFLMISNLYDAKLTYKVDGGAEVMLDSPVLLLGKGAVKLLGATQNQFAFINKAGTTKAASVKILVGRDATP
jgi:hypothetical protein